MRIEPGKTYLLNRDCVLKDYCNRIENRIAHTLKQNTEVDVIRIDLTGQICQCRANGLDFYIRTDYLK